MSEIPSSEDPQFKRLPVVISFLEDSRRLIEAGKARRWEVFKWTIAANTALIAAAYASTRPSIYLLFTASTLASVLGSVLILHYNKRLTDARDRASNLVKWIEKDIVEISKITSFKETERVSSTYDGLELAIFLCAIVLTWPGALIIRCILHA
jgi:hypothetical protein